MAAAAAVAAAAGLSAQEETVQQEQINAQLAREQQQRLLQLQEDNEPYVPLALRGASKKGGGAVGAGAGGALAGLGDLTGSETFFRRSKASVSSGGGAGVGVGGGAADISFLSVNAADLTARSLGEELAAQFEERAPAPGSDKVKVAAKFWNTSLGAEEQRTELSRLSKTKHQINALATNAAALEIELARQRAASYAKRDAARARYGF
jgi:hypothetical protein